MKNRFLKRTVVVVLCFCLILLSICSVFSVFHNCPNHEICSVCSALNSAFVFDIQLILSAIIVSGIVFDKFIKNNILLFSLVFNRVRINCWINLFLLTIKIKEIFCFEKNYCINCCGSNNYGFFFRLSKQWRKRKWRW